MSIAGFRIRGLVAALLCVGASACVRAEGAEPGKTASTPARKGIDVVVATRPPLIDGRLDDADWARAARIDDLTQYSPTDGGAPSERTEILLLRGDDNLYIGLRFHDSDAARIARAQLVQGQAVISDDHLQLYLDPYDTGRTGYIFYVNANGVQRDGLETADGKFNMDWNGIWTAGSAVTDDGWTSEIAIPYKTLSFDPTNDSWGINFIRTIPRKGERLAWLHRDRRVSMDTTGSLRGMRGAAQGAGLDLVPSLSLSSRDAPGAAAQQRSKPSLDAFYRITPALTASLTLNTDFSATDVDDRQVNLTRFSLFFPEKRAFFLEDATTFDFGGLATNGRPFFSRRIGLSATGQPIDLDVGAKLTGRVGNFAVGALAVQQAADAGVAPRTLFVGRAYANVLEQSTLGGIVTVGDPTSERNNSLVGVDFNYRDRLGGRLIDGRVWYQQSHTDGLDGDAAAWGAKLDFPNDRLDAGLGVTEIQPDFLPALGFVNRVNIRQYDGHLKFRHRFANARVRSWTAGVEYEQIDSLDGGLESRLLTLSPLTLDSTQGDLLTVSGLLSREVLPRPFEFPGRLITPAGDYDFERLRVSLQTAQFRAVSLVLESEAGDFYDGRRFDTKLGVLWRPGRHLQLNAQYATNQLELPAGRFTARVYSLTGNVAFNPRWAWLNLVQYDNVSRRVGLNSRIRWLPKLGQVAYLVLNRDWLEWSSGRFEPGVSELTLKASYTFRW